MRKLFVSFEARHRSRSVSQLTGLLPPAGVRAECSLPTEHSSAAPCLVGPAPNPSPNLSQDRRVPDQWHHCRTLLGPFWHSQVARDGPVPLPSMFLLLPGLNLPPPGHRPSSYPQADRTRPVCAAGASGICSSRLGRCAAGWDEGYCPRPGGALPEGSSRSCGILGRCFSRAPSLLNRLI